MNLWLITVNFGDISPTEELINSLSIIDDSKSIKIGIADNASTISSSDKLKQLINNVELDVSVHYYNQNYYYWPAAKKVLLNLKNKFGKYPEWVLICNNDITIPDKDFLMKLKEINSRKYPIIGPDILNSNGKRLNPFMKYPMRWYEKLYWEIYFMSYPISIAISALKSWFNFFKIKQNLNNDSNFQKVYAIHGSAILFSSHFFETGGWLDDNFDLYGEEETVAEIAKKINIPITYYSNLKIIHHEHSATKKTSKQALYKKAKKSYRYIQSVYK